MQLVSKLYIIPNLLRKFGKPLTASLNKKHSSIFHRWSKTLIQTSTLAELYFLRMGTEEILGRILRDLLKLHHPTKTSSQLINSSDWPPQKKVQKTSEIRANAQTDVEICIGPKPATSEAGRWVKNAPSTPHTFKAAASMVMKPGRCSGDWMWPPRNIFVDSPCLQKFVLDL